MINTGGGTSILPRVVTGYTKTTNPVFSFLTWITDVPVGSSVITSIHEKVEPGSDAPAVTFCHGTAKVNPWSWSLEVKGSLASAKGCWVDLTPQTRVQDDRGPVLNITCKIMSCKTPPEPEESGSQGVGPIPEQALHMPSAPEAPGAEEVEITSDDSFKMSEGQGVSSSGRQGVMPVPESTTCCFYISRTMMEKPANLWADTVNDLTKLPAGLSRTPFVNYHVMAIGWDWTKGCYHESCIGYGMEEEVVPQDYY